MDEVKQYKTAGAFRTALETRLQTRAQVERTDLQRVRRQVAFDRFLARLFPKGPKGTYPWILKGGYAMELRIRSARTTKDIDLTLHDGTRLAKDPDDRRKQVRAMLQDSAAIQLNDYFGFLVGEPREELDGAPEGGSRYPVEAGMDGRVFARFHVDIGIGDEVLEPPPSEWEPVFQALARECDLDLRLSAGFEIVQGFVGKILGRQTG